jgi:hypothetical protein
MVIWQWINDYLPPYAEQITINPEVEQIQETLRQFKQLVPEDFIKVETDYNFTTKSKWSKQLSERYSFEHEGEWFYIDIPHTIMESLELEKGEEIPYPFHLDPEVLKRKPTCGGITINNEKEIFLEKPFTVENLEEDIAGYYEKINELKSELKKWTDQFPGQTPKEVQKKIDNLQQELKKEQGWWKKWINDDRILFSKVPDHSNTINLYYFGSSNSFNMAPHDNVSINGQVVIQSVNYIRKVKENIKTYIYQYYREK